MVVSEIGLWNYTCECTVSDETFSANVTQPPSVLIFDTCGTCIFVFFHQCHGKALITAVLLIMAYFLLRLILISTIQLCLHLENVFLAPLRVSTFTFFFEEIGFATLMLPQPYCAAALLPWCSICLTVLPVWNLDAPSALLCCLTLFRTSLKIE